MFYLTTSRSSTKILMPHVENSVSIGRRHNEMSEDNHLRRTDKNYSAA